MIMYNMWQINESESESESESGLGVLIMGGVMFKDTLVPKQLLHMSVIEFQSPVCLHFVRHARACPVEHSLQGLDHIRA